MLIFIIVLSSLASASVQHVMSIQGKAVNRTSGALLTAGNVSVSIFDASTGGNLVFNDTFNNTISNGTFNVLLGSQFQLNLTYNKMYFMELAINREIVIGSTNRRQFFATGGPNQTYLTVNENSDGNVGIGTTSPTEKLNVQGGTLLVDYPSNPLLVGTYNGGGNLNDVYVVGKKVYTSNSAYGVQIIDVSNVTAPTLIGYYNTSGSGEVKVSGKYAYIAAGTSGLKIVDISNASSPTLIGTFATTVATTNLYVSGKYVYLTTYDYGRMLIIDVSDPSSPRHVGNYTNGQYYAGIYVSGRYAYIAARSSGLQIVDISNPSSPTLAGSYSYGGSVTANGIYVSGKYAYLTNESSDLLIINVTNPSSPTPVGSYDLSANANGVKVLGKYAYVANYAGGLKILDISNPNSPTLVGTYDTAGTAYNLFISGRYAYVADSGSGLAIIDIGGTDTHALQAGEIQSNYASITENVDIGNNLYVSNGLNVGPGGILSDGRLSVSNVSYFGDNVGIGTTSPSSEAGIGKFMEIKNNGTAGIVLNDYSGGATNQVDMFNIDGTLRFYFRPSSQYIVFSESALVGIQTIAPSANLNVIGTTVLNGTANTLALNVNNTLYVNTTTSNVGIGMTNPQVKLDFGTSVTNVGQILNFRTNGNQRMGIGMGNADGSMRIYSSTNEGDILFGTISADDGTTWRENVRIERTGKIGINTTSPTQTLTVVGTANITGFLTTNRMFNNTIIVAKNGGDFSNITNALNSVSDNSEANRYLIQVMPGVYNESITMKQFVDIIGSGRESVQITQNDSIIVTAASNSRIENVHLYLSAPNTAYQKVVSVGSVGNFTINKIKITTAVPITNVYGPYGISFSANLVGEVWVTNNLILVNAGGRTYGDGIVTNNAGTAYPIHIAYNDVQVLGSGSAQYAIEVYDNSIVDSMYNRYLARSTAGNAYDISLTSGPNGGVIMNSTKDIYTRQSGSTFNRKDFEGGKLGIGAISPSSTLEVNGSANTLALNVNNTLYVNTTTSNVGIGTTSPNEKLHIIGNIFINATGDTNATVSFNSSDMILSTTGWNGSATRAAGNVTLRNSIAGNSLTNRLAVIVNGSERVSVDSQGNVGIGTAVPGAQLQVGNNNNAGGVLITSWNAATGVHLDINPGTGQTPVLRFAAGSTERGLIGTGSSVVVGGSETGIGISSQDTLAFATGGSTARMVIDSTGKVGIGTTSPQQKMDINGTLIVNSSGNVGLWSNGTNVGIGTTVPVNTLHVVSSNAEILKIQRSGTAAIQSSLVFSAGNGTTADIKKYIVGVGSQNEFFIYDDVVDSYRMVIKNDGNVGIGTTSPNATLQVMGAANALALNVNNSLYVNTTTSNVGIGTTGPNSKLEIVADGTEALRFSNGASYEHVIDSYFSSNNPAGNYINFRISNTAGNPNEVMRLEGSGNVGIGTTVPSAKLHVNGTMIVNGTARINGSLSSEAYYDSLNDGLVLYLPFSDGTGTLVSDKSRYGRDGTTVGSPTWNATGRFGNAMNFGGTSDWINLGSWFTYQNFTIAFWVNPRPQQLTSGGFGTADIMDNYHNGSTNWVIQQNSTNTNQYTWMHVNSAFTLQANAWQYVVLTKTQNGPANAYVNGVLVTSNASSNSITYEDQALTIGRWGRGGGREWNGTLDEVRMYDRVLSTDEVRELYGRGLGTQGIYVNVTTGNVGIGTTNPQSKLQVGAITDVTISAYDIVANQFGVQSNIIFGNSGGGIGSVGGDINIYNGKLLVASNGNIGIGTTSPNATLNVRGGVNVTGSVNLATLEGNVGIGTTSPGAKLEISGSNGVLFNIYSNSGGYIKKWYYTGSVDVSGATVNITIPYLKGVYSTKAVISHASTGNSYAFEEARFVAAYNSPNVDVTKVATVASGNSGGTVVVTAVGSGTININFTITNNNIYNVRYGLEIELVNPW